MNLQEFKDTLDGIINEIESQENQITRLVRELHELRLIYNEVKNERDKYRDDVSRLRFPDKTGQ